MAGSKLASKLGLKVPIIQAPMAGIVTTEMMLKVNECGGLGSYGAGLFSAFELDQTIENIQKQTNTPFHINLMVHPEPKSQSAIFARSHAFLQQSFKPHNAVDVPNSMSYPNPLQQQVQVVLKRRPKVVSFCFGILDPRLIREFQEFAIVLGTATTAEEAVLLEKSGVDAIVAQGSEAGGHRSTFLTKEENALIGTLTLVPQICQVTTLPVIAAGGIMTAKQIQAALHVGADMVSMGTAFITTHESQAVDCYKKALLHAEPSKSCLTRAFTGRMARVLQNDFTQTFEDAGFDTDIPEYPLQAVLTSDLRASEDCQMRSLYCGQGYSACREESVHELMNRLTAELDI